jgi:crossover junction endodeoxyribonuclease RusA
VTAARPDKRKRDIDNLLKPISDLLKSIGAIEDDYLCEMISARWVTNGDGVAIRIEPAGIE